jgi:translation elongation factor P/translation initiation factor 5A
MSFDPSEPRDPHSGKWIKIAKGLKSFGMTAGDQDTVQKALGDLPKGGHGNLIKLNKVEIRRHQKGGVNLKINGESRYYENHQHAALAVIQRKHNEHGIAKPGKAGAAAPAPEGMTAGIAGSQLTPSQKKMTKTDLTDPAVHGSVAWEYEKGLITAEEYHTLTGHTPEEHGMGVETSTPAKTPGSVVTATQLKNGDTIWHNGEKWTVQGEPYHTTSGNSYFDLKPVESNLSSKSLSVDSNTTYTIVSPSTEAQSVVGSPAAKAVAKAKATPKPTGPYTEVTANAIMKGDVIKGINPAVPLKHYRVEKATKGSSSTTLQLIDVNGQTMTKVLAHGDKVQKSNTPEKFSVGSIPGAGSSGYAAAVQEYDAKADLPSGIKMGAQAWDSVAQVKPPDAASRSAISSYCGSGYNTVNPSLRKGLLDSNTATTVSAMDRAFISVAPLSSQIVVHRGFSNDQSILGSVGSHVGGVFIDNGFISTSTNESTSKGFGGSGVLCDIIVPAGVRVVKPGTISGHSSEKEIILNRGTKFKIVSDKMVTMAQWGKGVQKRRVVLEVIP